jgi:hypothetical protein
MASLWRAWYLMSKAHPRTWRWKQIAKQLHMNSKGWGPFFLCTCPCSCQGWGYRPRKRMQNSPLLSQGRWPFRTQTNPFCVLRKQVWLPWFNGLCCFGWIQVIQFFTDILSRRFCLWIFVWNNFVRSGLDLPLYIVQTKTQNKKDKEHSSLSVMTTLVLQMVCSGHSTQARDNYWMKQ